MGIRANLAVMQALQVEIAAVEKTLIKRCRTEPGYQLLKTVDGIGEALATVILLETGDIARLADGWLMGEAFASFTSRLAEIIA